MKFAFQTIVPVGDLKHDELRLVVKLLGLSGWEAEKEIGPLIESDGQASYTKLQRFFRYAEHDAELRPIVHGALIGLADEHVARLCRTLRAELVPVDGR